MKINSLRFKASILYSVILALILVVFSIVVYLNAKKILYKDIDEELKIKAKEIVSVLKAYDQVENNRYRLGSLYELLKSQGIGTSQKMIVDELWQSQLEVLNLKADFINILNIKGRTILRSNNFTGEVKSLFNSKFKFNLNNLLYKNLQGKGLNLRCINLPISYHNAKLIIQVGTSIIHDQRVLDKLLMSIVFSIIILLMLTSFIGSIFARSILKPVISVSNLANNITHEDLSVRIKEKETDIEMKYLIDSFNTMIARLEQAFSHISEFSSHAAHELKTPLAIIKGEIELVLSKERDKDEYKKVLSDALIEVDRMVRTIKDLLFLSKLDYKPDIFTFETINLSEYLQNIYEHSRVLAMPKNIKIDFEESGEDICVSGDKSHLRRVFFNIINNSVKFTKEGGEIHIRLYKVRDIANIDIIDTGTGISEKNIGKIFDKFFRGIKDDSSQESGMGLGLNIAMAIVKAHKGNISVKSKLSQGTTFTVTLPVC